MKQVELDELLAILGHEMGHWKLWHTIQGFVISQLYTFVIFLAFSYVQNTYPLFRSFGFAYDKNHPVPVFVGLMLFAQTYWMPVEKILGLILNFNSRFNEFAADAFSKKLGKADALGRGLIKISIENLGNLVPDSLYSLYHFSHPPLVERLTALGVMDKKKSN
jgi:STE24 endopeptidase